MFRPQDGHPHSMAVVEWGVNAEERGRTVGGIWKTVRGQWTDNGSQEKGSSFNARLAHAGPATQADKTWGGGGR